MPPPSACRGCRSSSGRGRKPSAGSAPPPPARPALPAPNPPAPAVPGLQVVVGTAPQALAGLGSPDAIFVGGGIADPELLPTLRQTRRRDGGPVPNVGPPAARA